MNKNIITSQLINYILLNAYSLNSSGLYNGKAGIALALFEYSRLTNDDYIFENAFEIIKEAIITQNSDISFEDGLSGIGYVLNHLIQRGFIDGDLLELYGENIEHITQRLNNTMPNNLYKYLTTLFFTSKLEGRRITEINLMIVKCTEDIITKLLTKRVPASQTLINLFFTYIKVTTIVNIPPSLKLLDLFVDAYIKKRIASNLFIGYYLMIISQTIINNNLHKIANKNIDNGIKNIHLETLSLAQRINTAYVMNECDKSLKRPMTTCISLKGDIDRTLIESIVLGPFDERNCIAGYQSGISRLVLYWVYKSENLNNIYLL